MNRATVLFLCALALLGTAAAFGSRAFAAPSACRYATPATISDVLARAPVVVAGRVESAGVRDGQAAYRITVARVLGGSAPATLLATYDGGSCAGVQPRFDAASDYVVFLAPFTTDGDGGLAMFHGSPHGVFAVDNNLLRTARIIESPFSDTVAAGSLDGLAQQLAAFAPVAHPWAALSTSGDRGEPEGSPPNASTLAGVARAWTHMLAAQFAR